MSSFVVSGLIHEVMLWYVLHTTDGRWLAFFSLQARHCPVVNTWVMTILVAIFKSLEVPLVLDHRQTHVYHRYQTMYCIRNREGVTCHGCQIWERCGVSSSANFVIIFAVKTWGQVEFTQLNKLGCHMVEAVQHLLAENMILRI